VNPDLLRSSGCGEKAKIWLWLSSVRSQNAGKLRRCQALSDGICSKPFSRERRTSFEDWRMSNHSLLYLESYHLLTGASPVMVTVILACKPEIW
jgi:hypothetical protein